MIEVGSHPKNRVAGVGIVIVPYAHLEVNVRPTYVAALSAEANHIPSLEALIDPHQNNRKVSIQCPQHLSIKAEIVFDHHDVTIRFGSVHYLAIFDPAIIIRCPHHVARPSGVHFLADWVGQVDTMMDA